jgi:hypothetical protein
VCELRYFSWVIAAKAKVAKSFYTLATVDSIACSIAVSNGHSLALLRPKVIFHAYLSCAQV